MWVPPENKDPLPPRDPTHRSVTCFGAVNLRTVQFVRHIRSVFNPQTFWRFLGFLKHLLRYRRGRRYMIERLENARYHQTALPKPFLRRQAKHLRLLYLPRYSPHHSPHLASIERVWKLARRVATHNRYFPTLEGVKAVNGCFDRCRPPNRLLRKLCCIV